MLNALKKATNYTRTENGAITHKSTLNKVLDMFAMGGACRSRNEEDICVMFDNAFKEDEVLALKCLFYLRDVRGGQGERRFFRVVLKHLANSNPEVVERNLEHIAEFGRWDDYYTLVDTPVEEKMWRLLKTQLALDVQSKTPSLLAKWLKSENASSSETRLFGHKTREAFGMTARQYRKTLSILRERINVLERLMSANKWDEIEFDAIPSKAGLVYRNAFARRDIIKEKYAAFAKNKDTKVNAEVLNPVDIAHECFNKWNMPVTERAMLDKYWANLKDYYAGREEKGVCVVDVSGSMIGTPMEAAVSLGAYIAERGAGPFKNHFITFSQNPELVEFVGTDIYDKFIRAKGANWGMNTDLKAVFNLLLRTAINENVAPEDMPERIYIFSDMEFDMAFVGHRWTPVKGGFIQTLMEDVKDEWKAHGYKLPSVVFWNLRSAHDNIPAIGEGFSYVSGYNPVMIDTILSGKDGIDLMLEKLNSDRYAVIH
jgi:hypothetical protein